MTARFFFGQESLRIVFNYVNKKCPLIFYLFIPKHFLENFKEKERRQRGRLSGQRRGRKNIESAEETLGDKEATRRKSLWNKHEINL